MSQNVSEMVYEYIAKYQERHHIPPTVREIADGCHISTSTVHYHLKRLKASKWISFQKGKARSIVLSAEKHEE